MKILNFVLCDLVRTEDNGKLILIGVYPANIVVSKFPARVRVTVWMAIETPQDRIEFNFRIIDGNNREMAGAEADLRAVNAPKDASTLPASIVLPVMPLEFTEDTTLSFQIREPGKRWKTIRQMPVRAPQAPKEKST